MAKAKNASDIFSANPVFDPAKVLENIRVAAEDNLTKAKANFEKVQATVEDIRKDAEAGFDSAKENNSKISLAMIDSLRSNTEATLSHLEKLVSVKSVAELVELQSSFLRASTERAVDDAKNLQSLYQKAGEDLAGPAKSAAEKAMKSIKLS